MKVKQIKTNKLENFLKPKWDIGVFLLRIFVGLRLLWGVIDNIISWEKMMEFASFLEAHHFPLPTVSAIFSVTVQFICGLLVLIGFKIRIASIILALNFIIALLFVHIKSGDTVEGMTPALAMLFGSLTFIFTGAGKISIDKS